MDTVGPSMTMPYNPQHELPATEAPPTSKPETAALDKSVRREKEVENIREKCVEERGGEELKGKGRVVGKKGDSHFITEG